VNTLNFTNINILIPLNFIYLEIFIFIIILLNICYRFLLMEIKPSDYIKTSNLFARKTFELINKLNIELGPKVNVSYYFKITSEFLLSSWSNTYLASKFFISSILTSPLKLAILFIIVLEFIEFKVSGIPNLYKYIKINDPSDQFTLDILNIISNLLKILMPLSLPFYYFAYREQKTISDSSLNGREKNAYLLLFILFAIVTLGYSVNITGIFKTVIPTDLTSGLENTSKYKDDIALIFLYGIFSIYFLFRTIREMLNSIDLQKLLKKKIRKVYINYFLLSFCSWEPLSKRLYKTLIYQIETVYQLFEQTVDKGVDDIYENSFSEWEIVLDYILVENRLASFDTTTKHLYLLNKNKEKHISFYKTLLKSHISLVMKLVKEHKIEDSKNSINKFLEHIPPPTFVIENNEVDEYYNLYLSTYYVALYELIQYLYENKNIGLYPVLDRINNESGTTEAIEQEGILRNFQAIIIKSIENSDVKMLSTFCYYMSNFFNQKDKLLTSSDSLNIYSFEESNIIAFKETASSISEKDRNDWMEFFDSIYDSSFEEVEESNDFPDYLEELEEVEFNYTVTKISNFNYASVFILLQSLAKSIELSQYKITGFLVKYLISNIDGDIFQRVFEKFKDDPFNNIYLPKNEYYKDLDDNFHFNIKVKDYILIKLFLLVYGQQKYIIENQVNFGYMPDQTIDPKIISSSNYLEYIFNKFDKAQEEYGLLFLQDEEFWKTLKSQFVITEAEKTEKLPFLNKLLNVLKSKHH
jgi:hypothetical protein